MCIETWKLQTSNFRAFVRGFHKIDYSGSSARTILEQNKFSKKVTSYRDSTCDPLHVFTVSCLPNCANSHCLKDWDFKDPYIVMLYWFQLSPLSPKVIDTLTKVDLKILQLTPAKITQFARHKTVNTWIEHYSPSVACSILVRGNFWLNLFCSKTILAELPEWSI